MTIGQTIKQLLEERKRVIFPGFGNLEVKESGSGIPSSGKTFDPPGLIIYFDNTYSKDDGVLAGAFAEAAGLEKEEAEQQVLELVDAIRFALDKGEVYSLERTGVFRRDEDGKVHFRRDASWVIEPDQYGLESMDLLELEDIPLDELPDVEEDTGAETGEDSESDSRERSVLEFEDGPVTEHEEKADSGAEGNKAEEKHEKTPETKGPPEPAQMPLPERRPVRATPGARRHDEAYKRSRLWRVIWIVTGLLIVILVVVILVPANEGGLFGKRKAIPAVQHNQATGQPEVRDQSPPAIPEATTEEMVEPEQDEVVEEEQDLFFIIAGSFRHLAYASELQDKLNAAGYPAEVMITENRMYRVCVGSYADKDEAESKLLSFKSQPGLESCWLLSNE